MMSQLMMPIIQQNQIHQKPLREKIREIKRLVPQKDDKYYLRLFMLPKNNIYNKLYHT